MATHRSDSEHPHCSVREGQLALPYQYFAGKVGSAFLIALRDRRKILGVRCDTCRKVLVPPRQTCDLCFRNLEDRWVELSDTGVVTNFTVVRYSDRHLPRTPPYILALIKLEGSDTPITHLVDGVSPDAMAIGLKVKAVFSPEPTSTILDIDHFEPA